MAGCVLAARLSEEPERTVCLVEAGPDYGSYSEGRWPPEPRKAGVRARSRTCSSRIHAEASRCARPTRGFPPPSTTASSPTRTTSIASRAALRSSARSPRRRAPDTSSAPAITSPSTPIFDARYGASSIPRARARSEPSSTRVAQSLASAGFSSRTPRSCRRSLARTRTSARSPSPNALPTGFASDSIPAPLTHAQVAGREHASGRVALRARSGRRRAAPRR
jgi:hypothetical protein